MSEGCSGQVVSKELLLFSCFPISSGPGHSGGICLRSGLLVNLALGQSGVQALAGDV